MVDLCLIITKFNCIACISQHHVNNEPLGGDPILADHVMLYRMQVMQLNSVIIRQRSTSPTSSGY